MSFGPLVPRGSCQVIRFIQSWHLKLETPPSTWEGSSVARVIPTLLGLRFCPVCSRPPSTFSPQGPHFGGRGKGQTAQLTSQNAGSPVQRAGSARSLGGHRESPGRSAAGLHIVPGEESSALRADALAPAVRVAARDVHDRALGEGELIVLLRGVRVQSHHCRPGERVAEVCGEAPGEYWTLGSI